MFLKILALLSFMVPTSALSWDLVELGNIDLEHKAFTYALTPYIGQATSETNLKIDATLLDNGYIRNTIHSQTDTTQYRLVGWNWELGTKIASWIEVGWWHFSKHSLDSQSPLYPRGWTEDGVVFRVHLHKGTQPNAIF